jgi:hypothetical protein
MHRPGSLYLWVSAIAAQYESRILKHLLTVWRFHFRSGRIRAIAHPSATATYSMMVPMRATLLLAITFGLAVPAPAVAQRADWHPGRKCDSEEYRERRRGRAEGSA